MTHAAGCAIAVMAKAPRPGRVKTRLTPPLLPEEAAAMSAAFLRDMTANIALASREASISAWIAYAPLGLEGLFDGVLEPGTGLVLADGVIDSLPEVQGFGLCLLHAAQALLAGGADSVCLVNSDSPTLPTRLLAQAAQALAASGDRAVLGPAEDGGYYLLGVKRPHARLFADIAWSTETVADQTRARAAELGLELVELAPWYDVDDRTALRRLLDGEPNGGLAPFAAPATAALIARLGLAERLRLDSGVASAAP